MTLRQFAGVSGTRARSTRGQAPASPFRIALVVMRPFASTVMSIRSPRRDKTAVSPASFSMTHPCPDHQGDKARARQCNHDPDPGRRSARALRRHGGRGRRRRHRLLHCLDNRLLLRDRLLMGDGRRRLRLRLRRGRHTERTGDRHTGDCGRRLRGDVTAPASRRPERSRDSDPEEPDACEHPAEDGGHSH